MQRVWSAKVRQENTSAEAIKRAVVQAIYVRQQSREPWPNGWTRCGTVLHPLTSQRTATQLPAREPARRVPCHPPFAVGRLPLEFVAARGTAAQHHPQLLHRHAGLENLLCRQLALLPHAGKVGRLLRCVHQQLPYHKQQELRHLWGTYRHARPASRGEHGAQWHAAFLAMSLELAWTSLHRDQLNNASASHTASPKE